MNFDAFVGIPYADKGRDAALDCWGLVARVFRDLRGIELPSYSENYVTAEDRRAIAALIAGELAPWAEIGAGQETSLDCVLMREGGFPRHIGVVTRPGLVLHVMRGGSSLIERYRSGRLQSRVVGFFRHRG